MELKLKIHYTKSFVIRILWQLFTDLKDYYLNPYPFLLIRGAFRRIGRRLKVIWLPRGRGRPAVSEEVIELIIDMKRHNPIWGALRISQEPKLLGVSVHKKSVRSILKEFGFLPPKLKFDSPSWPELFKREMDAWAMDFTCVFDRLGNQLFVLVIVAPNSRRIIFTNATRYPNQKWLVQQFRNIAIYGNSFPAHLIIDNDGVYGRWIDKRLREKLTKTKIVDVLITRFDLAA